MTAKIKSKAKKLALWALVAFSLGIGATTAYALPRQCRVQHCWYPFGVEVCYYDSGWFDC